MDPANSASKETVVRSSPVSDSAKSASKETIVLSVDSDEKKVPPKKRQVRQQEQQKQRETDRQSSEKVFLETRNRRPMFVVCLF